MTEETRYVEATRVAPGPSAVAATGPMLRRVSWGAIFAGGFITVAVWIMLSLLGAGIGLSVAQPAAGGTATNVDVSIGGAIWWLVTGIISMLIGGYVAARLSGVVTAGDAVLHGVTTWAITMLFLLYLPGSRRGCPGRCHGQAQTRPGCREHDVIPRQRSSLAIQ
ncbi:MAG: hypothetical protein ACREPJ_16140 [Rhodanobacteraceae bacterium]